MPAHTTNTTHLVPWAARVRVEHAFLLRRAVLPPRLGYIEQRLQLVGGENDHATEDGAALRMQLQHELGNDAEVGAAPADAPEEVRILALARGEDAPIRCDYRGLSTRVSTACASRSFPELT